jgi:hypothetical protein
MENAPETLDLADLRTFSASFWPPQSQNDAFPGSELTMNSEFIEVSRWKRELEAKGKQAFLGQGRVAPEQERIRELERENEILHQERDILKKQWPSSRTQADEIPIHGA